MDAQPLPTRILLIRPWTVPLAPLKSALDAAGLRVRITRVDIAPAMNAALSRSTFDVIVLDPRTPGVSREVVDAALRVNRRDIPVIAIESVESLVGSLKQLIHARLN